MPAHLPNQETLLLDYVRRLEHHKQGRRLVHFHLSRLKPFNRREHHVRVAANTFDGLVKELQGQLFTLESGDLVFIFKTEAMGDVEDCVHKLRFLFGDDPLLTDEIDGGEDFCSWQDVETDYEEILDMARDLAAHENNVASNNRTARDARAALLSRQQDGEPINPKILAKVETALRSADVSNLMRRQYACHLRGAQNTPQPEFSELYISVPDLRETILPDVNLTANRWLFQHLTETLDQRILSYLSRTDETLSGALSINLNISSLLSDHFIHFEDNATAALRGNMVLELQPVDLFNDLNAYLFAREYTKSRGYRICLDGITYLTLPFVDRERLGADFIKLQWDVELVRGDDRLREQVRRLVMRSGGSRVILTRCDTSEAIDFGKSIGIEMFQGRQVENLIAEENRRRNMVHGKRRPAGR